MLVERYGPDAHPARCVTLRCEEIPSLVELARHTDAVLIAIRAAGPDSGGTGDEPGLNATARFAMVTLAGRSEAPALSDRAPTDEGEASRRLRRRSGSGPSN